MSSVQIIYIKFPKLKYKSSWWTSIENLR